MNTPSQSVLVIAGLVAGIVAGALIGSFGGPMLRDVAQMMRPVGELWLSALQMTVVPLVIALLITAVASASDTASNGRLAARTVLVFMALLGLAALISAVVMPLALTLWPVDPQGSAALRAGVEVAAQPPPAVLGDWFKHIIPTNPFKAAADGAILPLVVFALFFGLAAATLKVEVRAPLLGFFQAVAETMLTIVKWVLWAAPLGVFALAINVGLQGGVAAAGGITQYVIMMCGIGILITLAAYLAVALFSAVPVVKFARAAMPAQAVGFSTQSSLVSLPAMLAAAHGPLGLSPRVSGIVLPLAVSVFRMTSPAVNLAIVLFVAHVYGVEIGMSQLIVGWAVAVVTSLAVVSLPSALTFFTTTVPISMAMGVPIQLLTLLVAVEVIPDLFRTLGNVTADLAAASIVGGRES